MGSTDRVIAADMKFERPERVANIADFIGQLGNLTVRCEGPGIFKRRLTLEARNLSPEEMLAKLAGAADLELFKQDQHGQPVYILRDRTSSAVPPRSGALNGEPITPATTAVSPIHSPSVAASASALAPSASAAPGPLEIRLLVGPGAVPTPLWVVQADLLPAKAGWTDVSFTNGGKVVANRTDGVSLVHPYLLLQARIDGPDRVYVSADLFASILLDGKEVEELLSGQGTCVRGTALLLASHARPPGRLVQLEMELLGPLPTGGAR